MSTHHVTLHGKTYKVVLTQDASPTVDGVAFPVEAVTLQPGILSLLRHTPEGATQSLACIADDRPGDPAVRIDGRRFPYTLSDPRSLRAASSAIGDSGPRPLKAPMPGRIVRVLVADGDTVKAGQGCVVMEAMKMQNELKAPKSGVVRKLMATVGEIVAANAVLFVID